MNFFDIVEVNFRPGPAESWKGLAQMWEQRCKELEAGIQPPKLSGEGVILDKFQVQTDFLRYLPKFQLELLDTEYFIPPLSDTKLILAYARANMKPYIPNFNDCDNGGMYVAAVAGAVFGVNPLFAVWDFDTAHFYNLILTPVGDIHVYEWQTMQLWRLGLFTDNLHRLASGKIYGF